MYDNRLRLGGRAKDKNVCFRNAHGSLLTQTLFAVCKHKMTLYCHSGKYETLCPLYG